MTCPANEKRIKELEEKEKFREARLNAHYNSCKKCKPDDYCKLYFIYHHHWIVIHEALKELREADANAIEWVKEQMTDLDECYHDNFALKWGRLKQHLDAQSQENPKSTAEGVKMESVSRITPQVMPEKAVPPSPDTQDPSHNSPEEKRVFLDTKTSSLSHPQDTFTPSTNPASIGLNEKPVGCLSGGTYADKTRETRKGEVKA